MTSAEILGLSGLLIGLCGSGVYIVSILRGDTKPHLFTWVVWSILTTIGYFAQLHDDTGPATWVLGANMITCSVIALLALKYGENTITRGDWIAFIASLTAIIPWLLTKDPLGSVILISLIDIVAFYPTIRKSWRNPDQENLTGYMIANLKYLISFFALEIYSINTLLYPATIVVVNSAFVAMCLLRRRSYAQS